MTEDRPARGARVPPFYAAQIAREASRLALSGREVIPMHFGQPTLGPPQAVLEAARHGMKSADLGYWESDALRARIARHYQETYGISIAEERILLTGGASAGLVAIFTSLFAAGDRIAVARPGYPAYRNTLQALARTAVEIDTDWGTGFHLTADQVRNAADGLQGLVVASPANPTGAVLRLDELRAIAEVCRARAIQVVSDEIYHGISYGVETSTALAVDPEAFVVNSFSKLYRMPGWRLGWIVVPQYCVELVHAHIINLFLTPPALSQHAALAAFDSMHDLMGAVTTYACNRARLLEELPGLGFANLIAPEGAFYIYADVRRFTSDSLSFCRGLLRDAGVALTPGIDFDAHKGSHYVRFSFAGSTSQIERAIELLRWRLR